MTTKGGLNGPFVRAPAFRIHQCTQVPHQPVSSVTVTGAYSKVLHRAARPPILDARALHRIAFHRV